jgi:ParB family chromosome partitioning protein
VIIDHKENGSGKLVITYSSLDELEGIIAQLNSQK